MSTDKDSNSNDKSVSDYELIEQLQQVPDELKDNEDWFLYDFDSEYPKAPKMPNGSGATWSDDEVGMTFQEAVNHLLQGDRWDTIGYRFHEDSEYFFMDFDGCFEEPYDYETTKEWSPSMGFRKDTYVEYSKSGTGAHVLYKGELPEWWEDAEFVDREHEGLEIYEKDMCIFTGNQIGDVNEIYDISNIQGYDFCEDVLLETYTLIQGEAPPALRETDENTAESVGESVVTSDVTEALETIDPHEIDVLRSEYQGDRDDTFEMWDPGYRKSSSGRALIRNTNTNVWYDFKHGKDNDSIFGVLSLFAAEKGRIDSPTDELGGIEWVNCYKNFKSKVDIELPELGQDEFELPDDAGWTDIQVGYEEARGQAEKGKCDEAAARRLAQNGWIKAMDTDEMYYYEDGIYHEDTHGSVLKRDISKGLKHQYTINRKSTIADKVDSKTLTPRDEIGADDWKVVVENGVLDLENRELSEHTPELNALHKLPVKYDADADEPEVFLDYLEDVVPDEKERKKLQEFVGYTLMHWDYKFEKGLFLVGPTNSGKSTFVDIVNMLHSGDATAHVTPQEIIEDRFKPYQLFGSWMNTRNDIPSETVKNSGMMKEILSGEEITIETKGIPNFDYAPNAKHIFAGNQLPTADIDDNAFYGRLLLVSMPKTIPRDQQDRDLLNKVESELPGVLNWAVDGLDRLLKQGHFTADRTPSETEQMWQRWSSSVKRFIHECINVTGDKDNDVVAKETAMMMFQEYTERRGMPSASQKTVTQTLKSNPNVSHTAYGGTDGSGLYEGISFTDLGRHLHMFVEDMDKANEKRIEELLAQG